MSLFLKSKTVYALWNPKLSYILKNIYFKCFTAKSESMQNPGCDWLKNKAFRARSLRLICGALNKQKNKSTEKEEKSVFSLRIF